MSKTVRYRVVDVFTTQQFEGNPLAVFPDARGLDGVTMQTIAGEMNLSESVFIFPPDDSACAARLRIFTPRREMPFAGHPTVGASFVLRDERVARGDRIVLQENIGPVPVRVEEGDRPMFWLTTPPIRERDFHDRARCAAALGLSVDDTLDVQPRVVDAGNPGLFIALRDRAAVDRAWIDLRGVRELRGHDDEAWFVFVFTPTASGAYSRMFSPEFGVAEDPATGSATGPLALYMMRNGLAPATDGSRFISEQGTKMGRRSLLHIQVHGDMGAEGIEVGGHATPLAEASMTLA